MRLGIVGDLDFSKPVANNSGITFAPKPGFGGGILLEFGLNMKRSLALEIGGMYSTRKYSEVSTISEIISAPTLFYPVSLKYWFGSMFGIGLGGYASYGISNMTVNVGGVNTSVSYSDLNLKKFDYGVQGSVAVYIPFSHRFGLLVDGIYCYGLANTATVGSYYYTDMHLLAGFRIGF